FDTTKTIMLARHLRATSITTSRGELSPRPSSPKRAPVTTRDTPSPSARFHVAADPRRSPVEGFTLLTASDDTTDLRTARTPRRRREGGEHCHHHQSQRRRARPLGSLLLATREGAAYPLRQEPRRHAPAPAARPAVHDHHAHERGSPASCAFEDHGREEHGVGRSYSCRHERDG
ncbi:hypothetical protein Dimus_025240, partial [Dionaea muscipula]